MSSGFNDRPLAPFAGILSLGIGDTMVSFSCQLVGLFLLPLSLSCISVIALLALGIGGEMITSNMILILGKKKAMLCDDGSS